MPTLRTATIIALAVLTVVGVGLLLLHLRWSSPWLAVPMLTVLALGWIGLARRPSWALALALGAVGVLGGVAVVALSPPTGRELEAAAAPLVDEVEWSWSAADPIVPWLAPRAELSATSDASSLRDAVADVAARAAEQGFEVRVVRPDGGAGDLAEEGPRVWDLVATRDGTTVSVATSTGPGGPFVHATTTWSAPVIGTWPYEDQPGSFSGVAGDAAVGLVGSVVVGVGSILGIISVVVGAGALGRAARRSADRPTVAP